MRPSGWKVRACGRCGGVGVAVDGSLEKRRLRPPQRLETEDERKVDELGEEAPPGGVTAPGEEAGEMSSSGESLLSPRKDWLWLES